MFYFVWAAIIILVWLCPTWLRYWVSESLVESKWYHYDMVEADSHLKLIPTSILDINTVFGHIDMLYMGIQYQPYTVIPTLLSSDFGVLGHLCSQNDVMISRLGLTATSNCFPHPYETYTKCLSTFICCPLAYSISLTHLYPPYLTHKLGFWVTSGVKMISWCHVWGWQSPQTASSIHIRHAQSVWAHWYAVHRHMIAALHSYTHPTSQELKRVLFKIYCIEKYLLDLDLI